MSRYNAPIETVFNPYRELGVNKEDSAAKIRAVYKKLIMNLHEDKKHTEGYKKLRISDSERAKALQTYVKAYNQIKTERANTAFPNYDEDFEYSIGEEYITPSMEFEQTNKYTSAPVYKKDVAEGLKNISVSKDNFTTDGFNSAFEKHKSYLRQNGYEDPNEKGSVVFGDNTAERSSRTFQSYSASRNDFTPLSTDEMKQRVKPHKMELVRGDDNFNLIGKGVGYHEIGGPVFGDMSIITNSLAANDLDSVYGQDLEYFEDTMLRNNKDIAKMRQDYNNGAVLTANDMASKLHEYNSIRSAQDAFKPKKAAGPLNGFKAGFLYEDMNTEGMDEDIAKDVIRVKQEIIDKDQLRNKILQSQEKFLDKRIDFNIGRR